MTYIENIFICLAIPLILSLFFTSGNVRRFLAFITIGMGICLLSAYISSFLMNLYRTTASSAAIEISPLIEETMKLLPLLFYLYVLEPSPQKLPSAAIALAVGFATLENVCYLTENGAADFYYLFVRGISAGALHIFCGILCGFGIPYIFRQKYLKLTGALGILGFCSAFHGIYNLLITASGTWRFVGYALPSLFIIFMFTARKLMPKLKTLIY